MSARLSTHAAFVSALGRASSIELGAYRLGAGSSTARALGQAAERGATVSVALEGVAFPGLPGGGLTSENNATARELRAHGVSVRLAGPADERLHLKAAIVDGVAFLDGRNWPDSGNDTIVRTSAPGQVRAVAAALAGKPASLAGFATEKAPALRLEARAIATARGDHIDVESESFGPSAVSTALRARARGGTHVRVLLSMAAYARSTPRERRAVAALERAGVEVRVGGSAQKLCVGGDRGWVGSANASPSPGSMLDWGLSARNRAMLGGLERSFTSDWSVAHPVRTHEDDSQSALRTSSTRSR